MAGILSTLGKGPVKLDPTKVSADFGAQVGNVNTIAASNYGGLTSATPKQTVGINTSKTPTVSPVVVTSEPARNVVQEQKKAIDSNIATRAQQDTVSKQAMDAQFAAQDAEKARQAEVKSIADADAMESGTQKDPYYAFVEEQTAATIKSLDQQLRDYKRQMQRIEANSTDPSQNAALKTVQDTFTRRAEEMRALNEDIAKATRISTIRSGLSRFAQFRAGSIVEAEEDRGIKRLTELDTERQTAEQKAIDSYKTGKYESFYKEMDYLDKINKQRSEAAENLLKASLDADKRAADKIKAAREEIKFMQDQEDRIIEGLAANVASVLDYGDNAANLELIGQTAEEYGLDQNLFMAAVRDAQVKQRRDELALASSAASLTRTRQLIEKGSSGEDDLAQILNVFGDFMVSEIQTGASPDAVLEKISDNAYNLGIKIDTKTYSDLKDIAKTMIQPAGIEEVDQETTSPYLDSLLQTSNPSPVIINRR